MVVVMRKGPWTEQEDLQLVRFVDLFGDRRWDCIAKVSGLRGIKAKLARWVIHWWRCCLRPCSMLIDPFFRRPLFSPLTLVAGLNRTGKSCRLRWVNYLHPDLKHGRITPQEERLILELHSRWGNRWARIARRLPGRTDNEIKNYWRTHTRKKKKAAQERISRNTAPSSVDDEYPSPEVEDEAVRELDDGGATAWFEETNDGWYVDQVLCGNIFLPDVAMMSFDEEFETSIVPSSPAWEYYGPYSLWKIDDDDDSKAYV